VGGTSRGHRLRAFHALAVTGTRPAQAALIPSAAATPDQLTAANVLVGWVEAAGFATSGQPWAAKPGGTGLRRPALGSGG
jgi:hypothetical protein